MKNKKLLLAAGALVLGAGTLASCGGSKADLKVWCSTEDVPYVEQVVKNFKADHAEYKDKNIKVIVTNEPDAAPALKTDPNASADVFHFTGDSMGELVRQELLYEIDSSYLVNNGIDKDVLASGQKDGKQYGIPFTPNTFFMFYDASVYTAEDVKSFEKMLAVDVSSKGYEYNFALDLANGWYLQSYFLSNGCTMYEKDKEAIAPRDKALHTSKWIWDYYKNEKLYPADGSAECGIKNAACVTGTWNAATIKANIEANGGTYAAAPLPACDFGDGEVTWRSVGDFKHVGVNSVTKEPEMACELAAYITNAESQKLRYEMRQTAPTNKAATDSIEDIDLAIVAQTEQLKSTFNQPLGHSDHNFWDSATAFGSDLQGAKEYEIEDWFDKFVAGITLQAE